MTREEAYNWNENSHDLRFTGEVEDMQESIYFLITKIYKHHEAEMQKLAKDCHRAMEIVIEQTALVADKEKELNELRESRVKCDELEEEIKRLKK